MLQEKIAQQRKTVATYRGVRKIRAEAELVKLLVDDRNAEALTIAEDSIQRARELLQRAQKRGMATEQYKTALAWILRAKAQALRSNYRTPEGLEVLDEAMRFFHNAGDERELFHSHLFRHILLRDRRRLPEARTELEYALELGRQLKMRWEEAEILGDLGTINHLLENYATAREQLEQSLTLFREHRERQWHSEVVVIYHMGFLHESIGDLSAAADRYKEALELGQRHRDADMLLTLLYLTWMYAGAYYSLGKSDKALALLDEWVGEARDATLDFPEASSLELKSQICLSCGRYVEALQSASRAHSLYKRVGNEGGIALTLITMGAIYAACGKPDYADVYLTAGVGLFDDVYTRHKGEDMSMLSFALRLLAHVKGSMIDVDLYLPLLSEKIGAYSLQFDKRKDILLRQSVALLHSLNGETDAAKSVVQTALEMSDRLGFIELRCDNHFYLAGILEKDCMPEEALAHYEAALRLAQASDRKDTERYCHMRLAELYTDANAPAKAQRHRETVQTLTAEIQSPQVLLELRVLHFEAELRQRERDNERLQVQLKEAQSNIAALQRLLDTKTAQTTHLKNVLTKLGVSLRQQESKQVDDERRHSREMIGEIENAVADEEWQNFESEVREQDEDFMQRLAREHPSLTNAERRVCALIRVNTTTTKDISRLLNISPRTVQMYRHRLRKKFNLLPEADLLTFIQGM